MKQAVFVLTTILLFSIFHSATQDTPASVQPAPPMPVKINDTDARAILLIQRAQLDTGSKLQQLIEQYNTLNRTLEGLNTQYRVAVEKAAENAKVDRGKFDLDPNTLEFKPKPTPKEDAK